MTVDTYVITTYFADYPDTATTTDYVSVVGRAYATARRNAAYLALNYLRSTPVMCTGQTDVPAKLVAIHVYGPEDYGPSAIVELFPTYTGNFRQVRDGLKWAEANESTVRAIDGLTRFNS